uniref:Uncharacterized protein n=1 Tax=Chromera velia CCMP2878 TaxID=1169474 RepID=A0A0G4HLN9_9ALVE|eukprot:Cvel_7372.t1-p1 / transcript=Cvel_7372.t1 / gene=Cvel_7372 / organism=Chromera_velia_CCMP2878 / gene_product=hypothetical protein / transcript_product=hypothetical protein / location=Cvel_scaffold383:74804-76658(+) / protein_length=68 / sequence_SO=supercontig / SO=protein_coding / is_pseudo=false
MNPYGRSGGLVAELNVWIGGVGEKAYMSGESYKPLEAPLPEGEIVEYITTCLITLHDVPYMIFPKTLS